MKSLVKQIIKKLSHKVSLSLAKKSSSLLRDVTPQLSLPAGMSEKALFNFITSIRVTDAPEEEMRNYGTHDFRRFVYTYGLVKNLNGKCLELGANPYFTTMLLKKFTKLELSLANYFGDYPIKVGNQSVEYDDIKTGQRLNQLFEFQHFNIETEKFPWDDNTFDLVICAEIIEHLTTNPCQVLREIKRILKPDGTLILTTPNVARLENVARLIAGINIYDPYSGYGPYGRHNREYNRHELVTLLQYEGFDCEEHFTANVHEDSTTCYFSVSELENLVSFRKSDLGQYIFIKAKNTEKSSSKFPTWLYRSMPGECLEKVVL